MRSSICRRTRRLGDVKTRRLARRRQNEETDSEGIIRIIIPLLQLSLFIHLLSNLYPNLYLQPTATPATISFYKPFIRLLSNLYPALNPQPTATPASISFYKPFIPTSPAFSNEEMAGTLEHHCATAERFRSLWSFQ